MRYVNLIHVRLVVGFIAVLFLLGLVTVSGCPRQRFAWFTPVAVAPDHSYQSDRWRRAPPYSSAPPVFIATTATRFDGPGFLGHVQHDCRDCRCQYRQALGVVAGTATLSASLQGLSAATTLTVTSASLVSIAITPPIPSISRRHERAIHGHRYVLRQHHSEPDRRSGLGLLQHSDRHYQQQRLASAVGAGSATISAAARWPARVAPSRAAVHLL